MENKWKLFDGISESCGDDKYFTKSFFIDEVKGITCSVQAGSEDEAVSWAQVLVGMNNQGTEDLMKRLVEYRIALLVEKDKRQYAEKALEEELLKKHKTAIDKNIKA